MNIISSILTLMNTQKPRHKLSARLLHWTFAPAVLALISSGLYITRPTPNPVIKNMNTALKTQYTFQYILIFAYLARLYHGYATKSYRDIIPDRKDISALPGFLKYELFLTKKKPKFPKYNPLQKILFTCLALLIPLQIVTGLSLYAAKTFARAVCLAGGLNPVRHSHYLTALAISSLAGGHIYFALTRNLRKLKSIFTGHE
ncbi:MAG: cytochrome b/b6 domain-containing protein [Bacillota bacterium]|jgi:Ni/Fe-hydrogenase 1 B-type cytochrome subunit